MLGLPEFPEPADTNIPTLFYDLVPGHWYYVEFDDCCTEARFVSKFTGKYEKGCVVYAAFANGVFVSDSTEAVFEEIVDVA